MANAIQGRVEGTKVEKGWKRTILLQVHAPHGIDKLSDFVVLCRDNCTRLVQFGQGGIGMFEKGLAVANKHDQQVFQITDLGIDAL